MAVYSSYGFRRTTDYEYEYDYDDLIDLLDAQAASGFAAGQRIELHSDAGLVGALAVYERLLRDRYGRDLRITVAYVLVGRILVEPLQPVFESPGALGPLRVRN